MTREQYSIRRYRAGDLPRVLDLTVEGFDGQSIEQRIDLRHSDVRPPIDWAERKRGEVAGDIAHHADGCFVAEADGVVVGYVTTLVRLDRSQGQIANLVIDRRFRNLGIGRALLGRALDDFRSRDLRIARIETLADNEVGNHLYPSLGFAEVARKVYFALELD